MKIEARKQINENTQWNSTHSLGNPYGTYVTSIFSLSLDMCIWNGIIEADLNQCTEYTESLHLMNIYIKLNSLFFLGHFQRMFSVMCCQQIISGLLWTLKSMISLKSAVLGACDIYHKINILWVSWKVTWIIHTGR